MKSDDGGAGGVTYSVHTNFPTCTVQDYAESCDVSVNTVRGWIKRDYIPVVQFGKYTFINLALLTENLRTRNYPDV